MHKSIITLAMIAALSLGSGAIAAPLTVGSSDNVQRVLETQKEKRVTVKLKSGDEITGVLKTVSSHVVHLAQLSGKEFYDAVVEINSIAAVIVRTK